MILEGDSEERMTSLQFTSLAVESVLEQFNALSAELIAVSLMPRSATTAESVAGAESLSRPGGCEAASPWEVGSWCGGSEVLTAPMSFISGLQVFAVSCLLM